MHTFHVPNSPRETELIVIYCGANISTVMIIIPTSSSLFFFLANISWQVFHRRSFTNIQKIMFGNRAAREQHPGDQLNTPHPLLGRLYKQI